MIPMSTQATLLKRMLQQLNRNTSHRAHYHNQIKTLLMLLIILFQDKHFPATCPEPSIVGPYKTHPTVVTSSTNHLGLNQAIHFHVFWAHVHVLSLKLCECPPYSLPSPAHGIHGIHGAGSHCVSETFRNFPSTPRGNSSDLRDLYCALPMLGRGGAIFLYIYIYVSIYIYIIIHMYTSI